MKIKLSQYRGRIIWFFLGLSLFLIGLFSGPVFNPEVTIESFPLQWKLSAAISGLGLGLLVFLLFSWKITEEYIEILRRVWRSAFFFLILVGMITMGLIYLVVEVVPLLLGR